MFQNCQWLVLLWIRVRVSHFVTVRVMGGVRVGFRVRVWGILIPIYLILYEISCT